MPPPTNLGLISFGYAILLFGLALSYWGLGLLQWLTVKASDPVYFCSVFNCTILFPDNDLSELRPIEYSKTGLFFGRMFGLVGLAANTLAWVLASIYILRLTCRGKKILALAHSAGVLSLLGVSFVSMGLLIYATSIRYYSATAFKHMHDFLKFKVAYSLCIIGTGSTALGSVLIWLEGLNLIGFSLGPTQGRVLVPPPYPSHPIYTPTLSQPPGGQPPA